MATYAWDHYIGPSADLDIDNNTKRYHFKITDGGTFSDFLRPRDGLLYTLGIADNVWTKYNLANAAIWSLKSGDLDEPLQIYYEDGKGFTLSGVSGTLRDIFKTSDEYKNTITFICEGHDRDFDITTLFTTSTGIDQVTKDTVINMAGKNPDQLIADAKTDQVLFWAAQKLSPFALQSEANDSSLIRFQGDVDDFSDQYKLDRAKYLYFRFHEGEYNWDSTEGIDFKDYDIADSEAEALGGQSGIDANYYWGKDRSDMTDVLEGYWGDNADHLYGRDGNDILRGNGGADYLEGGKGSDQMEGGDGNDTFYVGGEDSSYDIFDGGDDYDRIIGGAGNDTIRVKSLNDENSIEEIDGYGGTNYIKGTDEADEINLSNVNVQHIAAIEGGFGDDVITGSSGDDTIKGDVGKDHLYGGDGKDTLEGGTGDDELYGENKNDTLYGNDGKDELYGDEGNDELYGGNQDDLLYGGIGQDTLDGGLGDDTLHGGQVGDSEWENEVDILKGGDGNDTYYASSNDIITDSDGNGRVIYLGIRLTGGTHQESDPAGQYEGDGGVYTWTGGKLTFTKDGKTLTINGFGNRELGIYLDEEEGSDDSAPRQP